MAGGGRAVADGLVAFHAAGPSRVASFRRWLDAPALGRALAGLAAAIRSWPSGWRGATKRARGRRSAPASATPARPPARNAAARTARRASPPPRAAPATALASDARAAGSKSRARRPRPAGGQARADGRSGAELRAAGDDAVGDAGPEDAEAQQRQRREDQGHRVVDGRLCVAEPAVNWRKQRRADADDHGEHQDLDARTRRRCPARSRRRRRSCRTDRRESGRSRPASSA